MRRLGPLFFVFLAFICTNSFAQEFDLEDRFDPIHTLEFIERSIARASCTPICGTPTCCIAFEQRVVTHVSDRSFDEFSQFVQSFGFSVPEMIAAAATDNSLYDQMNLMAVTDLADAEANSDFLMNSAQALGADLSCSACCYPCGGRTCCGGCWTFKN